MGVPFSREKEAGRVKGPSVKTQQVRLTRDGMKHLVWKMDVQVHPQGWKAINPIDCRA